MIVFLRNNILVRLSIIASLFFIFSCSHSPEKTNHSVTPVSSNLSLDAFQIAELNNNFQTSLNEIKQEYGFPGITASYALPQVYVAGFASGMADKENDLVMQPHMLMLSASIGKMYVGAIISQLVREGVVNMNDPLSKWIGYKEWYNRLPNAENITIAHLASHTAGLSDHVYSKGFGEFVMSANGNADLLLPPEQLISFILDEEPLCAPGQAYHYTDTGFLLLGLVIEEATQQTYYDALKTRLLNPLHLLETVPADRRDIPNISQAYTPKDNMFGLPEFVIIDGLMTHHPGIEWTGGGLASSSLDLVRWSNALFTTDVAGVDYTKLVLKNAATRLTNREVPYNGYGLGVEIEDTDFGRVFLHSGWTISYMSEVSFFSETEVSIAFMVNTDDPQFIKGRDLRIIRERLAKVVHEELDKLLDTSKIKNVN